MAHTPVLIDTIKVCLEFLLLASRLHSGLIVSQGKTVQICADHRKSGCVSEDGTAYTWGSNQDW